MVAVWRSCSRLWRSWADQRSYRTSSPVSAGMGDRLRAGIPSLCVTSQLGQIGLAYLPVS